MASTGSGSTTYAASYPEKRSQKDDEHCAKTKCFPPPKKTKSWKRGPFGSQPKIGRLSVRDLKIHFYGKAPSSAKSTAYRDDA